MKRNKCTVSNSKPNVLQKLHEVQGDVDFQLTGQPINFSQRPGIGSGRASVRSFSVSGMSQRRSVSAVPSFQSQTELNVGNRFGWQRPQSADHSIRSNLTGTKFPSHHFDGLNSSSKKQSYFTHVKDVVKTKHYSFEKPLSLSSITDDTDQSNFSTAMHRRSLPRQHDRDLDYPDVFGSTYTLPDMLERTWTEEELIRYCDEAESLQSDEHCQSDISLGEHILSMAQAQCIRYSMPDSTSQPSNPLRSGAILDAFGSTESVLSTRLQRVERETDLLLKQLARGAIGAENVYSHKQTNNTEQPLDYRKNDTHQNVVSSTFSRKDTNSVHDIPHEDCMHIKLRDRNCLSSRGISSFDIRLDGAETSVQVNTLQPRTCRFDRNVENKRCTEDALQSQHSHRNHETDMSSITVDVSPYFLQLPSSPEQLPLSYRNKNRNEPVNADKLALSSRSSRVSAISNEHNSDAVETSRSINEECHASHYQEQVPITRPSRTKLFQYQSHELSDSSDFNQIQLVPTRQTYSESKIMQTSRIFDFEQNANSEVSRQLDHKSHTTTLMDDTSQRDSDNTCALSPNNSYSNMLMLIDLDEAVKETGNSTSASQAAGPSQATYEELVDVFQDFKPPSTIGSILASGVIPSESEYKDIVNNFIKDADLETRTSQSPIETILSNKAMPSEADYKQIVNNFLKDAHSEDVGFNTARHSPPEELSTYDDIVNILNVLELEEKSSRCNGTDPESISTLLPTHSNSSESSRQETQENAGHLTEILTYLDHVDKSSSIVLDNAINSVKSIRENSTACDKRTCEMSVKLEDLLGMNVVDLAHMVFTLRFQMEDKAKSVKALKVALEEEREAKQRLENDAERNMKSRLREQKDHYENAVLRHQKFIDQLIADKKALTEKVENMVSEMKSIEERYAKNLKVVEERHAVEIKRAKDTQAATNKLRMDSWINTKTKKIKEMTVKGLEPELVRMTTSHQHELAEVRQLHQHELKEAELRAARKTEASMELLRHQLVQEKEEAVAKERELLRQRLEKQAEQEEMLYQEHRHRLLTEVKREKQRLQQDLIAAQRDGDKSVERLKLEQQDVRDADSRRHASEIRRVKEAMEAEREAWARDYKKQKDVENNEREMQYREELRRERDQQIEVVIDRLSEEATQAKADLEQAYNNKTKKLKEQFETDLKETEESEQAAKTKYNKLKSQVTELEDVISELKVQSRQLEKDLKEEQKMSEMFSTERSHIKEVLRQEFTSQITSLDQELTKVRAELATVKTKYEVELNTMRTVKDHELQAVYSRVKNTVAQRDATIAELKGKCGQLEGLVEAQRKEYLIK